MNILPRNGNRKIDPLFSIIQLRTFRTPFCKLRFFLSLQTNFNMYFKKLIHNNSVSLLPPPPQKKKKKKIPHTHMCYLFRFFFIEKKTSFLDIIISIYCHNYQFYIDLLCSLSLPYLFNALNSSTHTHIHAQKWN